MTRRAVALLTLLLLIGAGCSKTQSTRTDAGRTLDVVDGKITEADADHDGTDKEEEVDGTIMSIDMTKIAADGPVVLMIGTSSGVRQVQVPSFGINLCAAKKGIADVAALKIGDALKVRGTVTEDGAITPCSSASHYLHVIGK